MVKWDSSKCLKCMICLSECDNHAICTGIEGIYIDKDACKECGNCIEACPNNALIKE